MTSRAMLLTLTLTLVACERRMSVATTAMSPSLRDGDRIGVRSLEDGEPRVGQIVVFRYEALRAEGANAPLTLARYRAASDVRVGEEIVARVLAVGPARVRMENGVVLGSEVHALSGSAGPCTFTFGPDQRRECTCMFIEETAGGRRWTVRYALPPCGDEMSTRDWPLATDPMAGQSYFGARERNPAWPDVDVPAGYLLMLGDDRDHSEDGRYYGLVPRERVTGIVARVVDNEHDGARTDLPLE